MWSLKSGSLQWSTVGTSLMTVSSSKRGESAKPQSLCRRSRAYEGSPETSLHWPGSELARARHPASRIVSQMSKQMRRMWDFFIVLVTFYVFMRSYWKVQALLNLYATEEILCNSDCAEPNINTHSLGVPLYSLPGIHHPTKKNQSIN